MSTGSFTYYFVGQSLKTIFYVSQKSLGQKMAVSLCPVFAASDPCSATYHI